jgi:galactose mutarotase-like enzyme
MTVDASSAETTWLGQPAFALETPSLRLVTVPGMGAKIVSLYDKRAGREWLVPPSGREFRPAAYGSSFVEQDMSGWDEIFPTTDACDYPVKGRYEGRPLPDHGEVWALPWQVDGRTQDSVVVSTEGRVLPYRLRRTARAVGERRIRLEYEVANIGSEPLVALWAAHPQFAVDAETRIVLPESVENVVNAHPTADWPEQERYHSWPVAETAAGRAVRLDRIGPASRQHCRKFYAPPDQPASWAALQQDGAGGWVRLSWDARQLPYLGIWVDEGTYNPLPTAALEPTTGYYDRLDRAWQRGGVMRLASHEQVCWHLDIETGISPMGDS